MKDRKYFSDWNKNHRERINAYERVRMYRIKLEVLIHYSRFGVPVCSNCGFSDDRALSIDHINGGGTRETNTLRRWGSKFYEHLKRANYPDGYQVLCMNCQFIKRRENKEYRTVIHWVPRA